MVFMQEILRKLAWLAFAQTVNSKSLWSRSPAKASEIINTTYPLGNGRLGAMSSGPAGFETLTLNLDTLWSGGPFEVNVSGTGFFRSNNVLNCSIELHRWQPKCFRSFSTSRYQGLDFHQWYGQRLRIAWQQRLLRVISRAG
jgi:hypothetical protein